MCCECLFLASVRTQRILRFSSGRENNTFLELAGSEQNGTKVPVQPARGRVGSQHFLSIFDLTVFFIYNPRHRLSCNKLKKSKTRQRGRSRGTPSALQLNVAMIFHLICMRCACQEPLSGVMCGSVTIQYVVATLYFGKSTEDERP